MFDNGGWLANPDSLGVSAGQRGSDRRQQMLNAGTPMSMLGLGISPEWDGFFDSLQGKRVRQGAPFNQTPRGMGRATQTQPYQTHEQWMASQGRT